MMILMLFVTEFVMELDEESILLVQITKKYCMYFRCQHRFYGTAVDNSMLRAHEDAGTL